MENNKPIIDEIEQPKEREFKLTFLALKNRTSVFILTVLIFLFGLISYLTMQRESFPEIVFPMILVQTPYPGNSPVDIENLITRPLEKELKGLKGVDKMSSNSYQDMSVIVIEFETDVPVKQALQDVKDKVDKAKSELPDDLDYDPVVEDVDFSEFPVMNINISGDYSLSELKKFAETLQDKLEALPEISEASIRGVDEREIQINVDLHKLAATGLTFGDISDAIQFENITMGGGEIKVDGTRRSLRVEADFTTMKQIEEIIVTAENDKVIYLKDVATIVDGFEEKSTISRLDNHPVVSLAVVKKSGENLLDATDKAFKIIDESKANNAIPSNLTTVVTDDQSTFVRDQISNLENSIFMGMIFVILILYLFLGLRNALFAGMAIPLSMFISFIILDASGYTINTMILFGLILALGMLVDNAIVMVENVYRLHEQGYSKMMATKKGVSEIATPIISSTATTLAAFTPLLLWEGIVGEFMKYLPITLIVVLSSSLFVALVLNPVFTATFVKIQNIHDKRKSKGLFIVGGIFALLALMFYIIKPYWIANLFILVPVLILLNIYALRPASKWFQLIFLTKLEDIYEKSLRFSLRRWNSIIIVIGAFALMIVTWMYYGSTNPTIFFFPDVEPNSIYVTAELPVGTDIDRTDEITVEIEAIVNKTVAPYQGIIKSIATTVGAGKGNEFGNDYSRNKSMVVISFKDFQYREDTVNGGMFNTSVIMSEISEAVKGVVGAKIYVEKDDSGPPVGNPINIEVSGDDYETLITLAENIKKTIDADKIAGIEELKLDIDLGKPEMRVHIDRDKVRRYGLSTNDVAFQLRSSIYGLKVDKFKDGEDEYDIMLRLDEKYRNNVSSLMNQRVAVNGSGNSIPISALANYDYSTSYDKINRKDNQRVVTVFSNVLEGYNANSVNESIRKILEDYQTPTGYEWKMTGEQEEQGKTAIFLIKALFIALSLIMIIMVTQFNSAIKPLIIMITVLFSTIGVFLGLGFFKMDFVILMSGIGIISLAGIVVNNGIVLIDFIELLRIDKRKELGLSDKDDLEKQTEIDLIAKAGKTRLRPVLLTAITTILGLLPLATGMNFNFYTLFSEFDPQIYTGGTNAAFWGPMSWAVIFGLSVSTFLTLIVAPVMMNIIDRMLYHIHRWRHR